MLRIRMTLPKSAEVHYRYSDILHDALINAWDAAGATSEQVCDMSALPWNFAALGSHTHHENSVHTLIVSTPDPTLASFLQRFKPEDVYYTRAKTAEHVDFTGAEIMTEKEVDFSGARIMVEEAPIFPKQNALGVLMLSPLVISTQTSKKKKRWYRHLGEFDLSAAINQRLSRLAGRETKLKVYPDSLHLRCMPDHSVLVPIKKNEKGNIVFVIGMSAPLVLMGPEEDLRFAWYAGLGEKTRSGFGCIGSVEEGVGR